MWLMTPASAPGQVGPSFDVAGICAGVGPFVVVLDGVGVELVLACVVRLALAHLRL